MSDWRYMGSCTSYDPSYINHLYEVEIKWEEFEDAIGEDVLDEFDEIFHKGVEGGYGENIRDAWIAQIFKALWNTRDYMVDKDWDDFDENVPGISKTQDFSTLELDNVFPVYFISITGYHHFFIHEDDIEEFEKWHVGWEDDLEEKTESRDFLLLTCINETLRGVV